MRYDWFFLTLSLMVTHSAAIGLADPIPAVKALAPCPPSRNCVSSQSPDESRRVDPFAYEGSLSEAKARLLDQLGSMQRIKIVSSEGNYIHAEFTSLLFHFVDDVEFLFDDPAQTIQVRSASRSGHYDFGVNRRRVEAIRAKFQADP